MIATGDALITKLRNLGVLRNKHIPAPYLRASIEQRQALLHGLFDTDGYYDPRTGSAEFCSINKRLAEEARELCLTLGFKAVIYEGRATLDGRDCGPKFRVCFTAHVPLFRLPRKLSLQRKAGKQAERARRRYIVAVEPVASVPVRCITVDSPSRLYLAGRAMIPTHNTRSGSGWVHERALDYAGRWVALIARTPADARDYMIEGPGGFLKNITRAERPNYEPSKRRLTWPNGSWATIYSDQEPDQLRGFSGDTAWLDEFAKFKHPLECWDNLEFGMRESSNDRPRRLITTTPRPLKMLRQLASLSTTRLVTGSSHENRANLDPIWFKETIQRYEGTRLGRQEIYAEILDDIPGALWTRDILERGRKTPDQVPDLQRVVVGVDPAVSAPESESEGLAETGIIVVALGVDGRGYVLDDLTCRLGPNGWARRAVSGLDAHDGDAIVAETNQGGAMVKSTIRSVRPSVKVIEVHASRGKVVRAEPIAALYEQGRVSHVGAFDDLEDQMMMFTPYGIEGNTTADRVDALVWALTELFPRMTKREQRGAVTVQGVGGYSPHRF